MHKTDQPPEGRYIVPALAQGLLVLGLFSKATPVLAAPDIAQRLDLPRTTVFRLLYTLHAMGFVQRDEAGRLYKLGPANLSGGFAYLASIDIVEAAQPILQRLRDETGWSAHMAVRDGREVVYVARCAARTTVASNVQIGTRFPVHATVLGRMTICEFGDEDLAGLFGSAPLPAFTRQTPTTLAALRRQLDGDRQRGYAVSQSFFEPGVSAVAAPVRDGLGRILAAINVTSVDAYVDVRDMHGAIKDAVLAASAEITKWVLHGTPERDPAPAATGGKRSGPRRAGSQSASGKV